jgi:hypothetical protein
MQGVQWNEKRLTMEEALKAHLHDDGHLHHDDHHHHEPDATPQEMQ